MFLSSLTTSDFINIILCILSFVLALISVVTVIITLRQNHKMIENSTRPYVVVSGQMTIFEETELYLVIKNYGSSGATIKEFTCPSFISDYSGYDILPFTNISNTFIAPGQSFICNVNKDILHDERCKNLIFRIKYKSGSGKSYVEDFVINFFAHTKNVRSRASTPEHELKIISFALQDLVERFF